MQIKTKMNYHFKMNYPLELLKLKWLLILNVDEDVEQLEFYSIAGGMQNGRAIFKNSLAVFLDIHIPHDSAIP